MRTNSINLGQLSPQAAAVFARAEKFRSKTLEPEAFTWEFIDRHANTAALREAARLGLTGIEVDKAVGGLGLRFREKVRIAEILSQSSMGFAFSLINSQNVAADIGRLGTDDHRSDLLPSLLAGRRFGATALTEPHAGSDFAAIKTSAEPTSSGWLLNGQKAWIANAAVADIVLCYAQTDPDEGRDGIALFLIDGQRSGYLPEPAYPLTAGATIGTSGFTLENFEVSDDDLLVEPGQAFRAALESLNEARVYVSAMACSMIRSGLAEAIVYGESRQSFGRPLLDHQGLKWSLAEVANQLEAAEALTAVAVDAVVQRSAGANIEASEVALAAAHAKRFSVEILESSLRSCMQVMGAHGLRSENRVGRLLSEARVAAYVDGSSEMQTERIGTALPRFYGAEAQATASVAYRVVSDAPTATGALSAQDQFDVVDEVADESDGGELATVLNLPIDQGAGPALQRVEDLEDLPAVTTADDVVNDIGFDDGQLDDAASISSSDSIASEGALSHIDGSADGLEMEQDVGADADSLPEVDFAGSAVVAAAGAAGTGLMAVAELDDEPEPVTPPDDVEAAAEDALESTGNGSIFDIDSDGFDVDGDHADEHEPPDVESERSGFGDSEFEAVPAASVTAALATGPPTPPASSTPTVPSAPPMPPETAALMGLESDANIGLGEVTQELPATSDIVARIEDTTEAGSDEPVGSIANDQVTADELLSEHGMPAADSTEAFDRLVPPMPPPSLFPGARSQDAFVGTSESSSSGGTSPAQSPPLPPPSMLTPPSDPPLPGDEHRIALDGDSQADESDDKQKVPPLPPDMMRRDS